MNTSQTAMPAGQEQLVIALFNERDQAEVAIQALQEAGFRQEQLGAVLRHNEPMLDPETEEALDEEAEASSTGVAVGSVAGGLAGFLGGLALAAIPGIGPFVGAGVVATTFGGAAVGAGLGERLAERAVGLHHFGVPHERIEQYTSALEAGQIAVSVTAHNPDEVMRAREVLGMQNADEVDVYAPPEAQQPPQSQDVNAGL